MDPATRTPEREVPSQIGRFNILRPIGAGGMGVVYAAWDPDLDRKVAVKLLHPNLSGSEREDVARARLVREAQAMARLSHPNVVSVYDVGTHDDHVFIAMEFVQGVSLAAWLRLERRSWREVLAVFQGAGRGLAAAHEQGLVHGDFKPDNVLVDKDGRVRVVDFGLAFAQDRDPAAPPTDRDALRSGVFVDLDTRLTHSGALTGTPAYCAPEQFRGASGSARTDQFSFCVSLHEGLYGVRPFAGDDVGELARAICLGPPIPEPPGTHVPAWLRKVVLRGLERDPDRRYPDLPALLAALARDPTRRRRRWLAAIASVLVLTIAAWAYRWVLLRATREREGLCAHAADNLVGVWDPVRRDTVRKAILATGLAYADDAWPRVAARLDDHTRAWTTMHTAACQATRLRGEQSEALLDLRMACLRRNLADVRALVDVLADADAEVVQRASQAVADLPELDTCADASALQGQRSPPATPATRQAHEDIATARARQKTARIADGLTIAASVLARAHALADPQLLAEAQFVEGTLREEAGEPAAAALALTEAFFAAESTRDDRLLAAIAIHLTHNAIHRPDLPAAHTWLRHAESVIARLRVEHPDEAGALDIDLLNTRGTLSAQAGQIDAAQQQFTDALRLGERTATRDPFKRAALHNNLGNILVRRGDLAGAEQHFQRSLTLYRGELGDQHPSLAIALNNLAEVHMRRGAWDAAEALYSQAHTILRATLDVAHPNLGVVENNLGDVLQRRDRGDQARAHYTRARTIFQTTLGPTSPALAYPLTGLGELLLTTSPQEAAGLLEQALSLRDDGEPAALARTRFALARALADDPSRANLLARSARDAYAAAGPAYARELADVDAWQQAHP